MERLADRDGGIKKVGREGGDRRRNSVVDELNQQVQRDFRRIE